MIINTWKHLGVGLLVGSVLGIIIWAIWDTIREDK